MASRKSGKKSNEKKPGKVTHRQPKEADWKKRWRRTAKRYRGLAIAAAVLVLALGGGRAYLAMTADDRDLSVIGSGTPVVVQLFEPTCFACQELDDNLAEAARAYGENDFVTLTLNINGSNGTEMARRYNARQTNLLLFDGRGNLVDRVVTVESPEQISRRIDRLLAVSG